MKKIPGLPGFIFLRDEKSQAVRIPLGNKQRGVSMAIANGNTGNKTGAAAANRSSEHRPWHKLWPEGLVKTINPKAYENVVDVIDTTCRKFAELPSFSNFGHTLTFAEIDQASRAFAAYFQSIGLAEGDRVAIQLPNLIQFPIAAFGALRAGLIVVNTNPLYTPREMLHQFNDSGAKAIVICANFAKHLEEILPKTSIRHIIVTEIGDMLPFPKRTIVNGVIKYVKKMVPKFHLPGAVSFRKVLEEGSKKSYRRVELHSHSVAFLQYTGGTTGVSKGAVLTHGNIVANMEQVAAVLTTCLDEGKEVCITPLPLYHIFSLTVNCLALFKYGTHNILITNPRDIPGFIKELKSCKFSMMTGVNTLFNALLNHPEFEKLDLSGLKFSVAGAMALQKPVLERWEKVTKSIILEGYGLTESSPVVAVNPPTGVRQVGTVGLPLPSVDVQVRDDKGNALPSGQVGELCVFGPNVMQGYWNKPEETAKVLTRDGWLKTGDMALINEDGYVKIVDRQKDMITVSGFKVYPNEVEEVLAMHPKILEAGVVGIPDEHSGEVVKAFVVLRDKSLTKEEIVEFARKNLTAYKVPRQIEFKDSLPKTNVGKILRRELR
jgi:long-chain acyl-CoA synthetase